MHIIFFNCNVSYNDDGDRNNVDGDDNSHSNELVITFANDDGNDDNGDKEVIRTVIRTVIRIMAPG